MDDQNKNLILATALSFLVILVWFLLFPPPEQPTPTETEQATATQTAPGPAESGQAGQTVAAAPPATGTAPSAAATPETAAPSTNAEAPRIAIDTPRLIGSISLLGGRIDELSLKDYRETLDPESPLVTLLTPVGSPAPYYALYGWAPAGQLSYDDVPGANTLWTLESGDTLDMADPVTMSWTNGDGLTFHRTISVDENYMFTIVQSVENGSGQEVRLAPYGIVARHGQPEGSRFYILHEGVVRQSDKELEEIKYKNMPDMPFVEREAANAEIADVQENGWIGFTDKYWMTTLIPEPGQPFSSVAKYVEGPDIYQVESRLPVQSVAPGATAESTTMLFAGAKEWETIRHYEKDKHIFRFVDSIDWGWFFFFTKPIFRVLHWVNGAFSAIGIPGSMGWAIITLTIIIKAILLPLAYKSYSSMAKMRELQPKLEEIKERVGDDRQKLQQEMMELYKREKVNPAAGCLPLLVQIPIFFSLYKVIFVTLELRQAPWIGWIRDLSAPDPSSVLNLFGLLPWTAPAHDSPLGIISLGLLPILLGISMWLQQKLNPQPTDPTQAMVFAWLPWIFMFMLGRFASGLVLYWIANNTLTFIQQYAIMRSHGYHPDVFGNIKGSFKRKKTDPGGK